jgi:MFS family permease
MAGSLQPATELTTDEVRLSLTSYNWNFGLRAVFDGICGSGSFVFVGFALALGVPKERVGFFATAISFACLLQMLGVFLANYVTDRKGYVIKLALIEPLVLALAVLLVPHLGMTGRLTLLLVAAFMCAAFNNLTAPVMADWLSQTLPAGIRGKYLGLRFQIRSATSVGVMILAGYIVEGMGRENVVGLSVLLAGGAVVGVLAVLMLKRVSLPPTEVVTSLPWSSLRQVLEHIPFRYYLVGLITINLPFYFACPYYQVFNLKVLQMRETHIAFMIGGYTVVQLISYPLLGRVMDRGWIRRSLVFSVLGYVFFFAMFPFAQPGRTWPMFVGWTVAGLSDAMVNVACGILLYRSLPEGPMRTMCFAVNSLVGIGLMGAGALLAVPILEAMKGFDLTLGGLTLTHFHIFYGALSLLMLGCVSGLRFLFRCEALTAEA